MVEKVIRYEIGNEWIKKIVKIEGNEIGEEDLREERKGREEFVKKLGIMGGGEKKNEKREEIEENLRIKKRKEKFDEEIVLNEI